MRCIVVGDSLPMPSLELKYEDTWVHHFRKDFPTVEVIDKCARSSSVKRLVREGINSNGSDLLEIYEPDFVITHLGIVDAAPRLLPRNAIGTKLLNKFAPPLCKKMIYSLVRKIKGRTISCCDLNIEQFEGCLLKYAERAHRLKVPVFCIKISYCGSKVLGKSPKMNYSIDLYNAAYDRLAKKFDNVTLINPLPEMSVTELDEILQSDGLHHKARASAMVYERVKETITRNIDIKKH